MRGKSPLSIALGGRLGLGKTSLWGTAEWFSSVGRFTVLDADPFQAQTSGEILSSDLHGGAREEDLVRQIEQLARNGFLAHLQLQFGGQCHDAVPSDPVENRG